MIKKQLNRASGTSGATSKCLIFMPLESQKEKRKIGAEKYLKK